MPVRSFLRIANLNMERQSLVVPSKIQTLTKRILSVDERRRNLNAGDQFIVTYNYRVTEEKISVKVSRI